MRRLKHLPGGYVDFIKEVKQYISDLNLKTKVTSFEWNTGRLNPNSLISKYQISTINGELFMAFVEAGLDAVGPFLEF